MAFCFSSGTAVRVRRTFHIWWRLGSSGSQNILDGSTMDAIVHGWFRSFIYFLSVFNAFFSSIYDSRKLQLLSFQIPVIGIDSLAYGKIVIVLWTIVRYNIFGGSERGPDLYGTSPWYSTPITSSSTLTAFYLWPLSLSPHWAHLYF